MGSKIDEQWQLLFLDRFVDVVIGLVKPCSVEAGYIQCPLNHPESMNETFLLGSENEDLPNHPIEWIRWPRTSTYPGDRTMHRNPPDRSFRMDL